MTFSTSKDAFQEGNLRSSRLAEIWIFRAASDDRWSTVSGPPVISYDEGKGDTISLHREDINATGSKKLHMPTS